ncbi:MAG: hypothetical protein SFU99_18590 [Saprospiraceae bacterium]|nr:hypothetical protein [Saprospiraceae bacterium]
MLLDIASLIVELLKNLGLPDKRATQLIVLFILIVIGITALNYFWKFLKWMIRRRNRRLLNRDLFPYYTPQEVYDATRYYIPTHYQNVAPSEDEEPGRRYIASARNRLIPLFLKKAFPQSGDDNRFYLLLADSGMGKTTFMINLYLAYKKQWTWGKPKYNIMLLPLGRKDSLERIEKMDFDQKKDTIILLDAFDEDNAAVQDYQKRMKELLELVGDFREIVITCRTQFFPSQHEEPHETGYVTFGGHPKAIQFQKLYISVFSDKDIKRYLAKRYNILNFFTWEKLRRAHEIVQRSPNLMVRPMLLSHIEDLVKSDKKFEYSYELYEVMIDKWLDREANKPGIIEKYGSQESFKQKLYEFSQKLAVDLYENREKRGGLFIPKDEKFGKKEGLQLEDIESQETAELSEGEKRSRSLLNRNAAGYYKFSHKSILEYFLALEFIDNPTFFKSFNFNGMEAAKRFLDEFAVQFLKNSNGEFAINELSKPKQLAQITIEDFDNIVSITLKQFEYKKIQLLTNLSTLKEITAFDKIQFPTLYHLYEYYLYGWRERRERLERLERLEPLERLERLELVERLELLELLELRELRELRERLELRELLELRERLELLKKKDPALIKGLQAANEFLRQMKWLEEKMPNTKFYY